MSENFQLQLPETSELSAELEISRTCSLLSQLSPQSATALCTPLASTDPCPSPESHRHQTLVSSGPHRQLEAQKPRNAPLLQRERPQKHQHLWRAPGPAPTWLFPADTGREPGPVCSASLAEFPCITKQPDQNADTLVMAQRYSTLRWIWDL